MSRQGQNDNSSAGGVIFLSEVHFIQFKAGLGVGTNNYAEMMALQLLFKINMDKRIFRRQIFEDDSSIIKMDG